MDRSQITLRCLNAASFILFAGVVLVVRPQADFFTPLALLPVCAAFFYALTSISSRFFDHFDFDLQTGTTHFLDKETGLQSKDLFEGPLMFFGLNLSRGTIPIGAIIRININKLHERRKFCLLFARI